MLHLVSIQVFFSMKNIILVNIPWKCENAKGIGQFHFSSNLSRSNLRAVGNRHLYKLRLHLCGHCEIARSFFRDWWTKRKKKKKRKEPRLFLVPSIIPHLRSPNWRETRISFPWFDPAAHAACWWNFNSSFLLSKTLF